MRTKLETSLEKRDKTFTETAFKCD